MTTKTKSKPVEPPAIPPGEKPTRGRPRNSGLQIPPAEVAAMQARGMTYASIATALGCSENFVGRLITRHKREAMNGTNSNLRLQRFVDAVNSGNTRALGILDLWEPADIHAITLDITGKPPLRFSGFVIREGSTEFINTTPDKPNHDFWTVRIYSVLKGDFPYAVAFEYSTRLKKIVEIQKTAKFTNHPALDIQAYNPLDILRGYPDLEKYDLMQERLERNSAIQYAQLVSDLLRDPL